MGIQFRGYRKKNRWEVTWKSAWTGKKHSKSFATEEEAINFETTQKTIAEREKEILKKKSKIQPAISKVTVRELLDSYFALAHNNPVTIKQSGYHASHIITAFGSRKAILLTRQDVLHFIEAQKLRGLTLATINRRVSVLRAALNWGWQNNLLPANPLAGLRLPRAKSRRIAPPSPIEANLILEVAAPHVQRVIILGIYMGARIGPSELFRLEWSDVDFSSGIIRMPCAHKNNMPDGRDIPIRKSLLPFLQIWYEHDVRESTKYVITWKQQPVKTINKAWHTALQKAGIHRRIRPYDLRHAYASYSLAGGADTGCVARIMGHTDASMILKTYQHVQEIHKRAAIEAQPDILSLQNRKKNTNLGLK